MNTLELTFSCASSDVDGPKLDDLPATFYAKSERDASFARVVAICCPIKQNH